MQVTKLDNFQDLPKVMRRRKITRKMWSAEDKAEVAALMARGMSIPSIARRMKRPRTSIYNVVAKSRAAIVKPKVTKPEPQILSSDLAITQSVLRTLGYKLVVTKLAAEDK